jgi:hypothetical protein
MWRAAGEVIRLAEENDAGWGNRSRVGVMSFKIAIDTEYEFLAKCCNVKAKGFPSHQHSARD